MKTNQRRRFLKLSALSSLFGASKALANSSYMPVINPTPHEIKGPFYPKEFPKDQDFDLTQIKGLPGKAAGKEIFIEAFVVDTSGKLLKDARVEIWQANTHGRYAHPFDTNKAPLDPHFQGWAVGVSGSQGQVRFKTIFPGVYPAGRNWNRPPHIHFKVTREGYIELITQMYFPGHALNAVDKLLQRKSKDEQAQLIASEVNDNPPTYNFTIVLQET